MALSVADVYDIAADIGKVLLLGFLLFYSYTYSRVYTLYCLSNM